MLKAIGVWKLGSAAVASTLGLALAVGVGMDPVDAGMACIAVEPPEVAAIDPPLGEIRLEPPKLEPPKLQPPELWPSAVDPAMVDPATVGPAAIDAGKAPFGIRWVRPPPVLVEPVLE